jgi:uroporphyrin-III C-methyltransferase / precorrin-2 dehydrogenase / sirohydrochlorin ferrochelatase
MQSFPIFAKLQGRKVLVVGGGEAAAAKLRLLDAAGADCTVLADAFDPALITGHDLVFGATGDLERDRAVSRAARAAHVLVNVVDRPELSDFIMPAVVDRGDVVIGISTNGASPVLARKVRAAIENALPQKLDRLAAFARRFRSAVHARLGDNANRRAFWEEFFEGRIADAVLAGNERAAARELIRVINAGAVANRPQGEIQYFTVASDDPEMLTLKALRALRAADLILHDEAIAPAVLDFARRDARRIAVGASSAQIERLIAGEVESGRKVVRLAATATAAKPLLAAAR